MFKEYFEGLTVTHIEFFDPKSGELLYGVSLQKGRLVGKKEGSAVGENDGPFDESEKVVEHKYFNQSGNNILVNREYNGQLGAYTALSKEIKNSLTVSSLMEKEGSTKNTVDLSLTMN